MKKYLLTWYGITDLRASLNLEQGDGPVLGALLAGHFSSVIVLGYTHPEKAKDNELDIQEELLDVQASDFLSQRKFIDRVANTAEAHIHFQLWLEEKLLEAGKKVQVQFEAVRLNQLNDTEGIYEAANQTLGKVADMDGEKLVTLYLSPGTPVMAFVWAFAALRYPQLKKRLIASSQPNKPPEEIVLPNEWLEWHGKQVNHTPLNSSHYDVVYHLLGKQRMPSLQGILQFSSKTHVFIYSPPYSAKVMKQFLGSAAYGEIPVDPYDPEDVRSKILDSISKLPSGARVGFNLTGGTKLMYAGALAACRKVNATPFYFNSRNDQVIYLNDFKLEDTKLIPSVEIFIKLNGKDLTISKSGRWGDILGIESAERKNLTYELWNARFKIARLYKQLLNYNNEFRPFELHNGDIYVKLSKEQKAMVTIGSKHYEFNDWPEFGKYLCGGWFEEYAYMELLPLLASGIIKDLRIGLEVSFKESQSNTRAQSFAEQLKGRFGETYQELDLVFTDGRRLFIVECKSGVLKGEYINKLESITGYFGGQEGHGILAYSKPTKSSVINQKAHEAHNVHMIEGSNLNTAVKALLERSGGR